MYNSIEYSDNYSKTTGILWQYYRDEPSLSDNGVINNFPGNSSSFKQKITCETGADCTKDVKIMVPFKYLSNFWRTNCEINLVPTGSVNCVISKCCCESSNNICNNLHKTLCSNCNFTNSRYARLLQ